MKEFQFLFLAGKKWVKEINFAAEIWNKKSFFGRKTVKNT